MISSMRMAFVVAACGLSAAIPARGGAFTVGDLVIDQVGTGSSTLTSSATQTVLAEYTTAGSLVQQILMPTMASGGNYALTNSGTATSEGSLTLSPNGQYLTLAGYNAALGTTSVASTSTTGTNGVARVVGVIGANGVVNTSTLITDAYSGNNIRGAVTTNGTTFYTAGVSGSTGGTHLVTLGSTGSTTQIDTSVTNTRAVNIFNGQLYTSSNNTTIGVYSVGTGIPTTGGQSTALITSGTPSSATNPDGFLVLGNNLYVADAGNGASYLGGILKYTMMGGTYVYQETFTAGSLTGFTGLTGSIAANGDEIIYAVDPTNLVSFDDNNTGSPVAGTVVATAAANTAFRGVAFAPSAVPEPASIVMLGLGLVGASAFALRRGLRRAG